MLQNTLIETFKHKKLSNKIKIALKSINKSVYIELLQLVCEVPVRVRPVLRPRCFCLGRWHFPQYLPDYFVSRAFKRVILLVFQ